MARQPTQMAMARASNPWGLTRKQIEALDALLRHCCPKIAADKLGISTNAFGLRMMQVRLAMGERFNLGAAIRWHDYKRTPKREDRTVSAKDAAGDGVVLHAMAGQLDLDLALRPRSAA